MKNTYFLLTLCVLFWSGNFIVGRYLNADVEPLQLSLFRWMGVALLLSPILLKNFQHIFFTIKKHFFLLNILALLSVTGFNTLLYFGLQTTYATNALLINSIIPVEILLLSFLFLKITISFRQLIGIFFSLFGVIFLIIKGDLGLLQTLSFTVGDFWVLLAGIVWALYSVLVKFKPSTLKILPFLTIITYLGLFWIVIAYLLAGYKIEDDFSLIQTYFPFIVYIAVFPSVLSYIFWNNGIEKIGANQVGQFTHLMPVFGSILAYIFLDEVLYFYHFVGAIIIMFGIYLSLFGKK